MNNRLRLLARSLGELLLTAGVVLLLFVVYELTVTRAYAHEQQQALGISLARTWAAPPAPTKPGAPRASRPLPDVPLPGRAFARLYLPSLEGGDPIVVVEGVGYDDLKKGPGHYPGTAEPGEVGNVALGAHRTTYGAWFNRVDELTSGSAVVLETRDRWFTYRVTGVTVVSPSAVGELDPVPNQPGVAPRQRLLTLTTCNPKYSARTRLVVRATLASVLVKGPGLRPPALTKGTA